MPSVLAESSLAEAAAQWTAAVERREDAAVRQTLAAWAQVEHKAQVELALLAAKVAKARAAGLPVSPAWAYQAERGGRLLRAVQDEVATFTGTVQTATVALQRDAATYGHQAATQQIHQAATEAATSAGVSAGFTVAQPENLGVALGYLADGSPLSSLLGTLPQAASDAVRSALIQGLTLGKGADWMARKASEALGVTRSRAETIVRTEAMRVYRQVHQTTYEANDDVLEGWVWHAALGPRTCGACWAMDGTFHPVTETLDGHPRCRCAMVPRTKPWSALGVPGLDDTRPPVRSGEAALLKASKAVQDYVLGPAKAKALRAGEISVDDLVARTAHPRWGTMRRERSLVEIRQGRNRNPQRVVPPNSVEAPTPKVTMPPAPKPQTLEHLRTLSDADLDAMLEVQHTLDPETKARMFSVRNERVRARNKAALDQAPPALPEPKPVPRDLSKASMDDLKAWARDPRVPDEDRVRAFTEFGERNAALNNAAIPERFARMKDDELRNVVISEHLDATRFTPAERKWAKDELARRNVERVKALDAKVEAERAAAKARHEQETPAWLESLPAKADKAGPVDSPEWLADLKATNPRYWDDVAYRVNCTHAVSTYELRRRGYDVAAAALPKAMVPKGGRNMYDVYRRWVDRETGQPRPASTLAPKTRLQGEKEAKGYGEGARGFVVVAWKGRAAGSHVFNWEVVGGKVRYYDGQSSKEQVAAYFDRGQPHSQWMRVDDLEPTKDLDELLVPNHPKAPEPTYQRDPNVPLSESLSAPLKPNLDLVVAYPKRGAAVIHKQGCAHTRLSTMREATTSVLAKNWVPYEDDWFDVAPCARAKPKW